MTYASIDIGSDTIKIVVGDLINDKINILASTMVRSVGVKKGIIIDKGMCVKSLSLALDEIEKQVGYRLDKALLTIPSYDARVGVYNGESYTEGIVTGNDIIKCFKCAIDENIESDREVVTVFPIDFLVDTVDRYYDPKGVAGSKLESRVLISTVPREYVIPYLEVLNDAGIEVIDLALNPISDYAIGFREDFKTNVGALVNIGNSKTEVGVFNKGLMIKSDILPIGSKLIDHDIKYIYGLDRVTCRSLKENLALATSEYADQDETMEFVTIDGDQKIVNQMELSQIVEARLTEILKSVKKSLSTLTNRDISYIIITGGICDIPGFNLLLEKLFSDKTYMINMNTLGIRSNVYSTCYGTIKYYIDKLKLRGIDYSMYQNSLEINEGVYQNMKEKLEEFNDN